MAAGCGYWWKDFGGKVHRCEKADHPVGTDHSDSGETKSKRSNEVPGETG